LTRTAGPRQEGPIGLTKTKAFKRTFVHWAAENFDWPGRSYDELFRYNKVLNEYEFPPLELLHFLLIALKLDLCRSLSRFEPRSGLTY